MIFAAVLAGLTGLIAWAGGFAPPAHPARVTQGACNPLVTDCGSGFPCAVIAFGEKPYRFVDPQNRFGERIATAEQWAQTEARFDYLIAVTRAYVRNPTASRRAYLARNAPVWFRGIADSIRQRVRRENLRGNRLRITRVNIDWEPLLNYPDAPVACYAVDRGWTSFLVDFTYEIRTSQWPKVGQNLSGPFYALMMGRRVYRFRE